MLLTILTICDFNYIDNFKNFLISYILNETNKNVYYTHFYIYENETELEKFDKDFKKCFNNNNRINIEYVKFKNNNISKKIFSMHYRFEATKKLIDSKKYDKILYLDIDSLINKSIYDICNNINYNLSVYPRININSLNKIGNITNNQLSESLYNNIINYEYDKFKFMGFIMAGIYLISNNLEGQTIINDIIQLKNQEYKKQKKYIKYTDQIVLSKIFKKYNKKINIYILDNKLFDFNMDNNNYIFMSKGKDYPTSREKWIKLVEKNSNLFYSKNFDLYMDRNKNNNLINNTLRAIIKYIKKNELNTIQHDNIILKKKNKYAIMFGSECKFKENTKFRKIIKDNYKNVLIVEQGYIKRGLYRSLSWDNQGGLSTIMNNKCSSERFNSLNIKIKDMKINNSGNILICGQVPWDSQVQFIETSYNEWLNNLFSQLKNITNKKIIFRYHPQYIKKKKFAMENNYEIKIPDYVIIDKNNNFIDSLENKYVVIAYNSTALIESIINGIPIICFNKMSLVYNLAKHNINDINNLYIPTKNIIKQTLYNISYCQWTLDELSNGVAIKYMINLLNKK